eukprot:TRINITY_DN26071_c0_g1_i2.p1 TRINITY_DN26071_c0_g1~~TRINITY_DN26071_c0_g1_i2.p1  ORF type:complete len:787 (+),score=110.67 TRINITY_DN26071_c0_g1_i2:177-2363(+)
MVAYGAGAQAPMQALMQQGAAMATSSPRMGHAGRTSRSPPHAQAGSSPVPAAHGSPVPAVSAGVWPFASPSMGDRRSSPSAPIYNNTSPLTTRATAAAGGRIVTATTSATHSPQTISVINMSPFAATAVSPVGVANASPSSPIAGAASTSGAAAAKEPVAHTLIEAQQTQTSGKCGAGMDVRIGDHSFRCQDVLGRGSYSVVWRAKPLGPLPDVAYSEQPDVALKEVHCSSQATLLQAVFEVQVLLALERGAREDEAPPPRVPRCICYSVEPSRDAMGDANGWTVHTAMTIVPGESLDVFFRRPLALVPSGVSLEHAATAACRRGCKLVERLLADVSPVLRLLEPIAWHRDVNAHNILIDGHLEEHTGNIIAETASFWLIDFGLAVDSETWSHHDGKWRTAHIGGDSRYWPTSSWIMHLFGPEGLDDKPEMREQYQGRLDIHGLGVTALEMLCTAIVSFEGAEKALDPAGCWAGLCLAWQDYWQHVWHWWSLVYSVFLEGGDIAPVQAQLLEEGIIERLGSLLDGLRSSCRVCAADAEQAGDACGGRVLRLVADMIDENSDFSWDKLEANLQAPSSPLKPASQHQASSTDAPTSAVPWTGILVPQQRSDGTKVSNLSPVAAVGTAAVAVAAHKSDKCTLDAPLLDDNAMNRVRARIRALGNGDAEQKARLDKRMRNIEESFERLTQRSLEQMKLGVERITQSYVPRLLELPSLIGDGHNGADAHIRGD